MSARPSTIPISTLELGPLRRTCRACVLRALCVSPSIPDDALNPLDAVVRARRPLERGQHLYVSGARFQSLYVVRSGSFKTTLETNSGEQQILGFHLPGEFIGFDAMSEDVHRCSAEALERASVCEVPYAALDSVAAQSAPLRRQLMRIVSQQVLKDQEHLLMMGRRQAQERLAIFLRSQSERYRDLGRPADMLDLPMSRHELANYLGLVVETVSRLFTRFQELNVLEVNRRQIRILDFARLDELADTATERIDRQAS